MDISSMTPEELRELAARKEAGEMLAAHIGEGYRALSVVGGEEGGVPPQFARKVEFEGRAYTVDMRRFRSRKYMRMLAEVSDMGGDAPMGKQLEIFDYALEPVSGDIERAVEEKLGYDDFEEYYRICGGIFEKVNAKN